MQKRQLLGSGGEVVHYSVVEHLNGAVFVTSGDEVIVANTGSEQLNRSIALHAAELDFDLGLLAWPVVPDYAG